MAAAAPWSPRGDLAWMCFPTWHDPAVLANLIGAAGTFSVRPTDPFVWGGYYEEGTLIWRSRWVTPSTIVETREALLLPAGRDRAVVLRRIVAVAGACHDRRGPPPRRRLRPTHRGPFDSDRDRTGRMWTGTATRWRLAGVPAGVTSAVGASGASR